MIAPDPAALPNRLARGGLSCDRGRHTIPPGSYYVRHPGTTLLYCLRCAALVRQDDGTWPAVRPVTIKEAR